MTAVWWVFGDSIPWGVGTPNPIADSWVSQLRTRIANAGLDVVLVNRAVGGRCLDLGPDQTITATAINELCVNPAPAGIIVAGGTNDMVTHDESTLAASKYALISIDVAYANAGVARRLYPTVLPRNAGSTVPEAWMPSMLSRTASYNSWLRAMWGAPSGRDQLIDLAGALREDPAGRADSTLMVDGLHPNKAGAKRIADTFPIARLT